MAPPNATWNGKDSQGNPLRWGTKGLTWNGNIPESNTPNPSKHMPILHVIISFDGMKDHGIEDLATAVSAKLYVEPAYNTPPDIVPPVSKADLDTARAAFTEAIPIATTGGPEETAAKNNLRAALIALLRPLAAFVDGKHLNNLELLLKSGFKASKTGNTPAALIVPVIKGVKNGISGQLLPKVDPIDNVAGFEPRSALIAPDGTQGPWVNGDFSKSARGLAVNGLTPGALYALQVRAHFANNQHSDWSDTVQHRAL
jgi:hypothetical protein